MSNPPKYYPSLKNLITLDSFPEEVDFIRTILDNVFKKIFYKDFQSSVSNDGSVAFYSLRIVTKERIDCDLFFGLKFILNRDFDDQGISSFPVTLYYSWPVIAYLKAFDLQNFSFAPRDFYEMGLIVFNISEEQVLVYAINTLVTPANPSVNPINQFVDDVNAELGELLTSPLTYPTSDNKIQELNVALKEKFGDFGSVAVFMTYLLVNSDIQETKERVKNFFEAFVPYDFEEYLLNIMKPEARVTLELSASVEFPRNILVPWVDNGNGLEPDTDPDSRAYFDFAEALLYADTKAGIGYQLELAGTLNPTYCEIGNTGMLLQIDSLKLDLSKKTNIPEADADGRPDDFVGVYARALSVTLPARWFHDDAVQGTPATTLRLGGYDLLIGTGGVSGTFMLETVPSIITGGTTYYFDDKFDLEYPIILFQKNTETNVIEEIVVHDLTELKNKLFPSGTTSASPCSLKFPVTLTEKPPLTGGTKTFETITDYQAYLSTLSVDGSVDAIPTMWKKVGSADKGFRVGFNAFDITFKQNKVISSNIKGRLEIKKFVYPGTNDPVNIGIEGHLSDDGDFNLTASAQPPYPIEYPDVFTYHLKSVELGEEDDNFYLGTSGTLQFEGFLKEVLKLGPIEIERLRIYSNGTIEFAGGSVQLIEPIVLPLGPVEITVSAIHYGSHQKEVNGVMRKFNYFGFDGGVSIDPLGIEVRGDGVKYYYCVDDLPDKPKPYLHIKTLYLDLTIPANSGSLAQISGWVTIPEPGVSKEYAGGITLQIPKANLAGKADIKLAPKYPAFIVDCELELPVPIPLGSFAIYGFRGLLGYRYVAEREAIGMTSENSWYEYYKAPKLGINVHKFSSPEQTENYQNNVTLGAGATLGTSADNGYTFSLKAMALFSIPPFFMIDGRAAILSARLGLDDTKEPPFFAFVMVGDDSLELGIGANYKLPDSGKILHIQGQVEMGFYFKNQKPWFINIGTKTNPIQARIIDLVSIKSFLMMSAQGIEAGARGDFNFDRDYGVIKVQASAFIEIGGKISFEKPQFGAYLMAGASARIKVLFVRLTLELKILFGVEAPKPFLVYGQFYFKIKVGIKIFRRRITIFKFSGNLEVVWNFNKTLDRSPINPLINASNTSAIPELVQGVNMLSNETFLLAYLDEGIPNGAPDDPTNEKILKHIIPLDTYIDIKTEKGLLPGDVQDPNNSVRKLIGGVNNAASGYADLIPPVSTIKGRGIRQVIHQYSIEHLEIKFWDGNSWENYHPYEALYPDPTDVDVSSLKVGHFQKTDGKYNAVRILATTPLSYTEQGQPGWHVPEQYGINASTLFCEAEQKEHKCTDFLSRPLNAKYYCSNPNTLLFSNDVAFKLLTSDEEDYAYVTDKSNVFNFSKSLAFDNRNSMEIVLPEPTIMARFKLSNIGGNGVRVKFYSVIQSAENDVLFNVVYGNPDPDNPNVDAPYGMILSADDLNEEIKYNFTYSNNEEWIAINPGWRPISKIVIEPVFDTAIDQQIAQLTEQIAEIQNNNELINLGIITGDIIPTEPLEEELDLLICESTGQTPTYFINRYDKTDKLNYYYSKEFRENDIDFIYSIGTTEGKGLISKIDSQGNLVWEKTYMFGPLSKENLIFNRIIQTIGESWHYIVYAVSSENEHYLLSFNPEDGKVIWFKKIAWKGKDISVHITPIYEEPLFYMVLSATDETSSNTKSYVTIIDSLTGGFINGIELSEIENSGFIVNSICENPDGIILAGKLVEGSYGRVIHINKEPTIISSYIIDKEFSSIHDIKYLHDKKCIISGYMNDNVFVAIVSDGETHAFYSIPNTTNHKSELQLSDNGYYLLCYDDYNNSILSFLSLEFEVMWSKTIYLNSGLNGIKNFTFNRNTKKITLNCFNQTEGSLVVHLNENFQSCLTQILSIPKLHPEEFSIRGIELGQKGVDIILDDVKDISEKSIKSTIIRYCKGIDCGEEDTDICDTYDRISIMYENCLIDPTTTLDIDFKNVSYCYTTILDILSMLEPKDREAIAKQIELINIFLINQDMESYILAWEAVWSILEYLKETGNCVCDCKDKRITMIHQVCWMSVENYIYNINIPSQEAIEADAQATIDGITKFIQPVWRPDTSYYIHFVLKDTIDNGANAKLYPFTYGFTTAGPVGYFHTADNATYGEVKLKDEDMLFNDDHTYFIVSGGGKNLLNGADNSLYLSNANGFILDETKGTLKDAVTGNAINKPGTSEAIKVTAHPDKYPLTSLAQYIDYNRSYPNADGNLLSAKPLFYNDEIGQTTQIYLFFNKAYATHFFQNWEPYKGADLIGGRLKVVIKDPVEDISIENPPYLNYDENDTIYTNIPQAVEVWNGEENPQIPFAINQYLSMYNAPNCIGEVTVIKPASEYVTIFPKHLKPNKLYTVIVNNMYNPDGVINSDIVIDETREVHKFVFKTSRYKDFEEQIQSFYMKQEINSELSEREAVFKFEKQFTQDEINASYVTILNWHNNEDNQQPITGFTPDVIQTLTNDYQHPYDRIFEGILGLNPWDEPVSTEVNVIRDSNSGNIIALIVRNPEPFNNPKFRKEVMKDTIQVIINGQADDSYLVLFSKDNSQAIIMNTAKNITENLNLKFKYKIYEDMYPGDDAVINYPVKREEELYIDLLNS